MRAVRGSWITRWRRLLLPTATMVALLGAVLIWGGTVGATRVEAAPPPGSCNDLLVGPNKDTAKTATGTVNADGTVTVSVLVSWSRDVLPNPGEKVADCVWDGQPGSSSAPIVASTTPPGADCSAQGLPCAFTLTTDVLAPGTHNLCDIAKVEGTWPKVGTGQSPSGGRTNTVCFSVVIPPTSTPPPGSTPPGTTDTPSTPPPTATPTAGDAPADATDSPSAPGLPDAGHPPDSGPGMGAIFGGALLLILGLTGVAFAWRRRIWPWEA